jgi:NhaP-type Na+/H+ or K+/H+ antiporter
LTKLHKNVQLGLSAIIVFSVAIIYGGNPSKILPFFFDFEVQNLELKNIFRAIMGLYMGFAIYWVIGISKKTHWKSATISNIIFMGGLAFGRLISTIFDGISNQYTIGMLLEFGMMGWGVYNLKKHHHESSRL